ncbi:MAG: hypothetical protein IPH13_12035 [Planctomycetes bacterium]|nr:hypothetical protein [Planctomycetota bacterium]
MHSTHVRIEESGRSDFFNGLLNTIRRIEVGNGFVIAINVWPFPAQLVGVAAEQATANGHARAFAFPVRVLAGTIFATPDQLPMFMEPRIRRISTHLLSIRPEHRNSIVLTTWEPDHPLRRRRWNHVGLDVTLNGIIEANAIGLRLDAHNVIVPADTVRRVWFDSGRNHWFVDLDVEIRISGDKADAFPRSR